MTDSSTHRSDLPRRRLAAASLLIPLLALGATWLAYGGRLPGEIPTHWGPSGRADDFAAPVSALRVSLIVATLAAIGGCFAALRPGVAADTRRAVLFGAGGIAAMAATGWIAAVIATDLAGAASAVPALWVIPPLVAAFAFGYLPFRLSPTSAPTEPERGKSLPLRDTEAAAWSGVITSRMGIVVAIGLLTLAAVMLVSALQAGQGRVVAVPVAFLVAVAVVAALSGRLRVTADQRGLRVVTSAAAIPVRRIPLDRIDSVAAVATLEPMVYGGWGPLRFAPGRSATVFRRGPALTVTTTSGTEYAVTVPDPQTPASVLAALIARRRVAGNRG